MFSFPKLHPARFCSLFILLYRKPRARERVRTKLLPVSHFFASPPNPSKLGCLAPLQEFASTTKVEERMLQHHTTPFLKKDAPPVKRDEFQQGLMQCAAVISKERVRTSKSKKQVEWESRVKSSRRVCEKIKKEEHTSLAMALTRIHLLLFNIVDAKTCTKKVVQEFLKQTTTKKK